VAELWALIWGLQLAKDHNLNQLLVEGDSQILVNLLGQLLNGVDPDKISPSW
jgi:ribonuclease HI